MQKENILSIRLTPSGLYFAHNNKKQSWLPNKSLLTKEGELEKLLTKNKLTDPKITCVKLSACLKECELIPSEFVDSTNKAFLHSNASESIVELIPLNEALISRLNEIYGARLMVESAMLEIKSQSEGYIISVAMYEGICSIVISEDGQIKLAQNLPCENHADLIYYLSVLNQNASPSIEIYFDSTKKLAKKLKPYYKKIKNKCA